MDAIEQLRADHQRVKGLFGEASTSESEKKRRAIFQALRRELELHAYVEETAFYPYFAKFSDTRELVDKSLRDHREIHDSLEEIAKTQPGDGRFNLLLERLQHAVFQHIAEEEGQFFPRARKLLRKSERDDLGKHIHTARLEKEREQEVAA